MSMNGNISSHLPWLVCVLLLGLCGWLVYELFDQSVTLDHQDQHSKLIQQQRDLLEIVANATSHGTSETQIRTIVNENSKKDSRIEKAVGHLVVDQVSFFFRDGKLIKITTNHAWTPSKK